MPTFRCVLRLEFYTDYRQFLKDYYEERKRASKSFSYRQFCLKAGIRSPSLFLEVAEGRRNLTEASILQFAKGLNLTESDTHLFSVLVHYSQAKDSRNKQRWFEDLRGLRRRVEVVTVPLDRHDYYARWYHPVLRELACCREWEDDPSRLGKMVRPPLSAKQTKEAIALLINLGFLIKDREGRWHQPSQALTTGSEVDSLLVRSCNRQFAELAAESFDSVPPPLRDSSSMVIGIGAAGFRRIKEEIRHFKDRIARIAEDETSPDRVYSLNLHFLPHSQPEGSS